MVEFQLNLTEHDVEKLEKLKQFTESDDLSVAEFANEFLIRKIAEEYRRLQDIDLNNKIMREMAKEAGATHFEYDGDYIIGYRTDSESEEDDDDENDDDNNGSWNVFVDEDIPF